MASIQTLLVAVFDARSARYVVPGHPDMSFRGEKEARQAGCIVMPQGPCAGEILGLSSMEAVPPPMVGPPVISRVPGTVQRPPNRATTRMQPEPAALRRRHRKGR